MATLTFTSFVERNPSGVSERIITAEITAGNEIPKDIFLFSNTGTSQLGDYFGVCTFNDYSKYSTFNPAQPTPVFGNMYVKHDQAKIVLPLGSDLTQINLTKDKIEKDVKAFKAEYVLKQIPQVESRTV